MADDVTLPGTGAVVATDDIGSGRQVQLVKPVYGADGSATMVAADAGLPTAAGSMILSGSASANNTDLIASTDVSGYQMFSFVLSGTYSASVVVQGSNDGSTWVPVPTLNVSASSGSSNLTTSAQSTASVAIVGWIPTRHIRLRTSSYSSGTVTATMRVFHGSQSMVYGPAVAVTLGAGSTASDAASLAPLSSIRVVPSAFNGSTYDRVRTARIFKSAVASASGDTAVWTPTSGNRFQLLSVQFFLSGQATITSGAQITVKLRDNTTDIGISVPVYVPGTSGNGLGGWTSGRIDLGDFGYRSAALNNVLNVNLSAALTTGEVGVIATGVEE